MKRFTQYLYEYRQSGKSQKYRVCQGRTGKRGGKIQIQTRGLFFSPTEKLKVYLFYEKNGMYEGILQGEIGKNKPLMQYILTFSSEEIGNEVCGIFLEDREKKRYMAVWNGETINVDTISTEHLKEIEIQESDRREIFVRKSRGKIW